MSTKCKALIIITAIIAIFCLAVNAQAQTKQDIVGKKNGEIGGGEGLKLAQLNQELKKYTYVHKDTVITGKVNIKIIVNTVDVKQVETKKEANCVEFAVITKKECEKLELKSSYVIEDKHITVKVTTKNGASYRYSNGRNTGRVW